MRNKILVIALILAFIVFVISGIIYLRKRNSIKPIPAAPYSAEAQPSTAAPLIGGDKDKNGCLIGAGYSWCEVKTKCIRVWEEKCE